MKNDDLKDNRRISELEEVLRLVLDDYEAYACINGEYTDPIHDPEILEKAKKVLECRT